MTSLGIRYVRPLRNLLLSSQQYQLHSMHIPAARSISTNYEFIKTDVVGTDGRVGLVTLNRPKALNALCAGLMDELIQALNTMDSDAKIGAMVVTGSEKVYVIVAIKTVPPVIKHPHATRTCIGIFEV